jgi:glycosyltransferase involved in cell wall biosynthesis
MVYEVNRNLVNAGLSVAVVAPNDAGYKNKELMEGVVVHRFNYFFPTSFQKLAYGAGIPTNIRKSAFAKLQIPFFASSFLKKTVSVAKDCDIIHAQWIASGFIGLLAKKIRKKPVVVTVRQVPKSGIMASVNRYVLKNADYVIFNSSYTKKESFKIAKPKRFSVIHNSIDIEKFKPMDQKRKFGKKVILSVGLLVEKKGLNYLLDAFAIAAKKHPEATLIIAGDGPKKAELIKKAKRLRIKVRFIGTVDADKTPALYNSADIVVLPSIIDRKGETETLGVVLLEALACKKPVIASDVGGIPDIVDSSCGILVPQKNPKALANAIDRLLSSQATCRRFGENGRKKLQREFSPHAQTQKTIKVYESLVR